MSKIFVSKVADFEDGKCRIVAEGDLEVGVYRRGSDYHAYENMCLHQGGPACEGITMHKVEEILRPDKTYVAQRFNMEQEHIVCPWHGYEYDMKNGECVPDRSRKLKKFQVVTEGDSVYVLA